MFTWWRYVLHACLFLPCRMSCHFCKYSGKWQRNWEDYLPQRPNLIWHCVNSKDFWPATCLILLTSSCLVMTWWDSVHVLLPTAFWVRDTPVVCQPKCFYHFMEIIHTCPFFRGLNRGREGKHIKELNSAQHFLFLYFTGCNGSHLLCFKPSTSGTKAGARIVLQSGSAAGHEKTYLYQVVAVPPKGFFEKSPFIIWEIHLYSASRTFLDNLHMKSPELAEAQRKAKFSFALSFLLHSSQGPEFNNFIKMCQFCQ